MEALFRLSELHIAQIWGAGDGDFEGVMVDYTGIGTPEAADFIEEGVRHLLSVKY